MNGFVGLLERFVAFVFFILLTLTTHGGANANDALPARKGRTSGA